MLPNLFRWQPDLALDEPEQETYFSDTNVAEPQEEPELFCM